MKNFHNQIRWILQEKYKGKTTSAYKKDVERLKAGEPVDYIIGFSEFLGCKIDVSKRTLIPRVETEFWVGEAIEEIKNRKPFGTAQGKTFNELKVLDMFAGSGCIGVAVLKHVPQASVIFADKEKNCIQQVKINCRINKISKNRYKIIQSDVFDGLYPSSSPLLRTKYNFVFANPPYIPDYRRNPSARLRSFDSESLRLDETILRNRIQNSVLEHEPHVALFGGGDGLFYIRKLLEEAKSFLAPEGKIFMEFDSIQKSKIEKLLKGYMYTAWQFHKDQYGKWRYVAIEN